MGWTWLCDHCSQHYAAAIPEDAGVDVARLLDQLDAMHYCEKKKGH